VQKARKLENKKTSRSTCCLLHAELVVAVVVVVQELRARVLCACVRVVLRFDQAPSVTALPHLDAQEKRPDPLTAVALAAHT
jgi:hypothetical protein